MTTFSGPGSTFITTVAQVPTSPTRIGNSLKGSPQNMPDGVQVINAIPSGGCLTGVNWNENTHDGTYYSSSGQVKGPPTCTRNGTGRPANLSIGGGIWGISTDGTYIFYVSGNGYLIASRLANWNNANAGWDNGQTVLTPLSVSSHTLMDCVTSGGYIYVLDANGSIGTSGQASPTTTILRKIGPFTGKSWGSIAALVTVPYARRMCFDREGNLWVLTQGVSGNPSGSNRLLRYGTSGTLLHASTVPSSVGYAMDIACDPSQDRLFLADNGSDQQIKILSYDNTNATAPRWVGSIGQQAGWLDSTSGAPGQLGPLRFAGLRGVALDSAGNMYVVQSLDPFRGQANWPTYGTGVIVSMLRAGFTTEAWRLHCGGFGLGVANPTSDWSAAYSFCCHYPNESGEFGGPNQLPDRFTVNPSLDWTNRISQSYGPLVTVRDDINPGTRYVIFRGSGTVHNEIDIYQEKGQILIPRVSFGTSQGVIIANKLSSSGSRFQNTDCFMDDQGNVWLTGYPAGAPIHRFRLRGFTSDGTPLYNWSNHDTFPLPPQINSTVHNIVVHGSNIYLAGFTTADDPNLSNNPGGSSLPSDYYKMLGRVICKWSSLPTSSGWAAPAWTQTITYPSGGAWSQTGGSLSYPNSFDVDEVNGVVVICWFHDTNQHNIGWLTFLDESTGAYVGRAAPPFPAFGQTGSFDMLPRSISCANGWVWCEDDWAIKTAGMSLAAE